MTHKQYKYRGVISGMDIVCEAEKRWMRVTNPYTLSPSMSDTFAFPRGRLSPQFDEIA